MELEQYRINMIDAMEREGPLIRRELESKGVPVKAIYLHGSVLSPQRFGEDSDIDMYILVKNTGVTYSVNPIFVESSYIDTMISDQPLKGRKLKIA